MKDTELSHSVAGTDLRTATIPFPHSFEFCDVFRAFENPSGPFASSEIVLNQNIARFMDAIVTCINRYAADHSHAVMVAVDMQWAIEFTMDGPIETVAPVLRITGTEADNRAILTRDIPGLANFCALTDLAETLVSLVVTDQGDKPILLSIAALYIADVWAWDMHQRIQQSPDTLPKFSIF